MVSNNNNATVDDAHDDQSTSATTRSNHHHNELSPLLLGQVSTVSVSSTDEEDDEHEQREHDFEQQQQHGQGASMFRTVMSLMKVCLGTGCLALPCACREGGIIAYIIILCSVAIWNLYSIHRLIVCLHYLPDYCYGEEEQDDQDYDKNNNSKEQQQQDKEQTMVGTSHHRCCGGGGSSSYAASSKETVIANNSYTKTSSVLLDTTSPAAAAAAAAVTAPPENTTTLGKVAWYAFGKTGLECLDVMMTILLMGIVVSYLVAVIEFLSDTFVGSILGGHIFNAFWASSVIAFLSLVPNVGFLSRFSLIGLGTMTATFLVIAGYGLFFYDGDHHDLQDFFDDHSTTPAAAAAPLALWPISRTGFSHMFGVCIFGFGIVPLTYNFRDSMRQPERFVTASGWALLCVASVNALIGIGLYILFPNVVGEILHELPLSGILPTLTRLAMAVVVIMTAPLLVVPMAELLEGKWHVSTVRGRSKVRFGVCLVSAIIAVLFPGFVQVLSFVGCAFVGLLSFCVPPILLLRLRYIKHYVIQPRRQQQQLQHQGAGSSTRTTITLWRTFGIDAILAVAGLVATIAGTISILAEW